MEDSSEDSDSEAEFDEESIIKYYFNHGHTYEEIVLLLNERHMLRMEGLYVPRIIVQGLLKELDPEGTQLRRARRLKRRIYYNPGAGCIKLLITF